MSNPKSRFVLAAVGALSVGPVCVWAGSTDAEEMKLRQLEEKVAALEARQAASSKDLAATVDAVLRDAERRSQLLANSGEMGAGYDGGFFIKAGDAWVLRPGAHFQFRYVTNFRDGVGADEDEDFEDGFEVRRMRFDLKGTAFMKELTYFVQWESAAGTNVNMRLLEAWANYMFADQWGFKIGQFKDPVTHEFYISSARLMAADYSLVDLLLGGGVTSYTQGAMLVYGNYSKDNPVNVILGVTDGAAEMNTDFQDASWNWGVAGRAEFKFMGDWKNYQDFTAKGTKEDLLVAGIAGDWSQNGDGDQLVGTADLQFENASGLGLYGAGIVRFQNEELVGDDDTTDWGVLVQASYLFNPNWEVFARYDVTLYDEDRALKRGGVATGDTEDTFNEITVGINYYLGADGAAGHRAKFTVDLTYLPDGSPAAKTGSGILDDNGGDDEWILRAQFQLVL